MTKGEALKKMQAVKAYMTSENPIWSVTEMGEAFDMAIEALTSAQSEQQWIPCSEKLPEKYIGKWMCCMDDGTIEILPYDTPGDGSKECVFYYWEDDYAVVKPNVVAWMPLPSPYTEGTK